MNKYSRFCETVITAISPFQQPKQAAHWINSCRFHVEFWIFIFVSASVLFSVLPPHSLIVMCVSCVHYDSVLSLARQWTMEDEEEVERERRRRVKSSSSIADPDDNFSQTTGGMPTSDSALGTDSTSEMSQGLSRLFSQFSKALHLFVLVKA